MCRSLARAISWTMVFLTTAVGIAMLAFGIYLATKCADLNLDWLVWGMIAAGGGLFLMSILGFTALNRRSFFLNLLYVFLLLCVLAAEVAGFIMISRAHASIDSVDAWNKLSDTTKQNLQSKFECCGYDDLTQKSGTCEHTRTCKDQVHGFYDEHAKTTKWVIMGVGIFQILNVISVILLASSTHDHVKYDRSRKQTTLLQEARALRGA